MFQMSAAGKPLVDAVLVASPAQHHERERDDDRYQSGGRGGQRDHPVVHAGSPVGYAVGLVQAVLHRREQPPEQPPGDDQAADCNPGVLLGELGPHERPDHRVGEGRADEQTDRVDRALATLIGDVRAHRRRHEFQRRPDGHGHRNQAEEGEEGDLGCMPTEPVPDRRARDV
jgi:hypothetical protein